MSTDWIIIFGTIVTPIVGVGLFFWRTGRKERREAQDGPSPQEVDVTVNGGLHPSRIVVRAGRPIRLRFRRTNDGESWWDDVEFPYVRLRRELQEGETAVLDVGALEKGEYAFFSALGTMRGALVVEPPLNEEPPEGGDKWTAHQLERCSWSQASLASTCSCIGAMEATAGMGVTAGHMTGVLPVTKWMEARGTVT